MHTGLPHAQPAADGPASAAAVTPTSVASHPQPSEADVPAARGIGFDTSARVTFLGTGSYLPSARLTTNEVRQRIIDAGGVSLPRGFLRKMTGIESRPVRADNEYASTLATNAARAAMRSAGIGAEAVDLLIFASASRDMIEPATAHAVQEMLGTSAHCFDMTNACNSFLNGIDVAAAMIETGRASLAVVCVGETPSQSTRWDLRSREELVDHFAGLTFGDAGAAVVLGCAPSEGDEASEAANSPAVPSNRGAGLLYRTAEARSEHWQVGGIFGGGSRHPREPEWTYFRGDGRALREAFEVNGDAILRRTLRDTGTTYDDYARILVHQVTTGYLDHFVEVTGIPADRLVRTVDRYGNLAAATIGIQLDEAMRDLTPGDLVLLIGLGGGISLTTMVWRR
ncbi:MAG: hypothetical protein KGP01_01195 [Actinomycetales bacterium]|nr:hypothetical protein [Actinomycetales bacterium]